MDKFRLLKYKTFCIKESELLSEYASQGYFRYKEYLTELDPNKSFREVVRNAGITEAICGDKSIQECVVISILDVTNKIKTSAVVDILIHADRIYIKDLLECITSIYKRLDSDNKCFVKFDLYHINNRQDV